LEAIDSMMHQAIPRVSLHSTVVQAPSSSVQHWALFLHGILGRGSNWQTFARHLVDARPEWGAVLADLRMHGASQEIPPPHDMATTIADVRGLAEQSERPVHAVIGHSFGGKVAVGLLDNPPSTLRQIWVLDASPSARGQRDADDLISRVLIALERMPARFDSRGAFIASLESQGIPASIAQWLAKNVVRSEQGLVFGLKLQAIGALLADHDQSDLWPLVEAPPPGIQLSFVLGGRSRSVSSADRERLQALARQGVLELHVLPEAGHWLHADDPAGLLRILAERLA
jgi:pimeloyl-ACP methyl ester carboxylesterase